MLERPDVEQFLKGLNRYPTTTMGHLITFMHSFNLRFGVAKTPEQEAAYDQIYPMLVQLRDQAQAQGPNPMTGPGPDARPEAGDVDLLRDAVQPLPAPAGPARRRRPRAARSRDCPGEPDG